MKAQGSYDPVTQSVSAGGEYTKTDYQEKRKDTLIGGGFILVAIVVFAALLLYFWSEVKTFIGGLINGLSVNLPSGEIPPSAVRAANSATPSAAQAVNNAGQYYPVKTLTAIDYDNMLKSLGMIEPVVRAGNFITPPGVIDAASQASSEAASTVNRLSLNNAYVDLPAYQKGLVTLGEGVGKLFGVDLIQAGYDMRSAITTSAEMSPDSRDFLGVE